MKVPTASVLLLACLLAAAAGAASAQKDDKAADPQHFKPWDPPGTSSSNMYVARLRGSGTSASALMSLIVDDAAGSASYSLMMYNIPQLTMSHIHVGAANVSGPPVVLLLPGKKSTDSNVIAGGSALPTIAPIDICTMTYTSAFATGDLIQFAGGTFSWADFMSNLKAGTLYANIHTLQNATGLIRGQLMPAWGWKKNIEVSCADRKGWKYGWP